MPSQVNQPLPSGYVLNGYRIDKPLSSGGFSIVYLAHDENQTPFAIKEYLPASLALRTEGTEVRIEDPANLSVFRHGLKCFFEEGRALALISHPNVVRVENFFRAITEGGEVPNFLLWQQMILNGAGVADFFPAVFGKNPAVRVQIGDVFNGYGVGGERGPYGVNAHGFRRERIPALEQAAEN